MAETVLVGKEVLRNGGRLPQVSTLKNSDFKINTGILRTLDLTFE